MMTLEQTHETLDKLSDLLHATKEGRSEVKDQIYARLYKTLQVLDTYLPKEEKEQKTELIKG